MVAGVARISKDDPLPENKRHAMDILMIEAVTAELQQRLAGARIEKIFQPEADILIFRLWNGRESLRLLMSASSRFPRLYLTEQSFPNPMSPPRFCQLLRARISRLMTVRQVPGERIVEFECSGPEKVPFRLVVEMVGRHANLILTDAQGTIVDLLERRADGAGGRRLLPGEPYRTPPPRDLVALENWDGVLPAGIDSAPEVARWLFRSLAPMSSYVARELAVAWKRGEALAPRVAQIALDLREKNFAPTVGRLDGEPCISPFPVHVLALADRRDFSSPSEAADYFHRKLLFEQGEVGEKQHLQRVVERQLKRVRNRMEKIAAEKNGLKDADRFKEWGDLLLAHLYQLRRGMKSIEVENYYRDPPRPESIALDPRLTPQENAEKYFRRSKKMRRGGEHIERRLNESHEELDWLEGVRHALAQAAETADIAAIRSELEDAGLMPSAGRLRKSVSADPRSQLRTATTPNGYQVFWGKNSRTNDYLSKQFADARDFWFHAYRMPGSHLVLKVRLKGEKVPEEDILFAAAIAAGYSRGAKDTKVEVMVARAGDVHKPKGARPGLVTVDNFRTVLVKPQVHFHGE